jgi:hypothetical protein
MEMTWQPSMTSWATAYQMQYCIGSENPPVSWVSMNTSSNTTLSIFPILSGQDYWVKMRVMINGVYWGTTKEQKIGRSGKSITMNETSEGSTELNLYPNPFAEQITMEVKSQENSLCNWSIYDMTGNEVIRGNNELMKGENTLNIDASELAKGVYMLNAIINNEKHSFRILKQ